MGLELELGAGSGRNCTGSFQGRVNKTPGTGNKSSADEAEGDSAGVAEEGSGEDGKKERTKERRAEGGGQG